MTTNNQAYFESRLKEAKNRSGDPVASFRFYVELEGIIQGYFTECSGLSIEREVYTHREGGINDYEHKLPGRVKHTNITLKKGIAANELWNWFKEGLYDGKVNRQDMSILLYNSDRTKVKRWNLSGVYPIKWTGPDLNTEGAQSAIETVELVHHGFETVDWQPA